MGTGASFALFLVLTVLLLGGVVATGIGGRIRPHLTLVALTLASLGVTIYFAEQLGALYDLDAAGAIKHAHLALAKVATLAYAGPLATGWLTLRNRRHKRAHLAFASLAVVLTIAAAVTGTWMISAAEPLESVP